MTCFVGAPKSAGSASDVTAAKGFGSTLSLAAMQRCLVSSIVSLASSIVSLASSIIIFSLCSANRFSNTGSNALREGVGSLANKPAAVCICLHCLESSSAREPSPPTELRPVTVFSCCSLSLRAKMGSNRVDVSATEPTF